MTVRSPDAARLSEVLQAEGAKVVPGEESLFTVVDMEAARIGELAAAEGLVLHELTPTRGSLEDAFMELTRDSVEYDAVAGPAQQPPAGQAPAQKEEAR